MKKIIIILLIAIGLSGCGNDKVNANMNYEVGVFITKDSNYKSQIQYFDKDLNHVESRNLRYAALETHFRQTDYYNNLMYLVPVGIFNKKDTKKVLEYDLGQHSIKEYDVDRINIQDVAANDKYIYSISNLNWKGYLTQINKDNQFVNELITDEIPELVVCIEDKVFVFMVDLSTEGKSLISVLDKNLNLIRNIDTSTLGVHIKKYAIADNKLYFSATQATDEISDCIGILDLTDYSLNKIEIKAHEVGDMIAYDGYLYVSHSNEATISSNTISKMNLNNYNDITTYNSYSNIMRMEIIDDSMYILGRKDDQYYLEKYDVTNSFEYVNKVKIEKSDKMYVSSLFVNKHE